jgi:hypothetical protein
VKARARNAIGWGPFGDPVAGVPDFSPSNWMAVYTEDAMDGSESMVLGLPLNPPELTSQFGNEFNFSLQLLCSRGEFSIGGFVLFLDPDKFTFEYGKGVQLKFDDRAVESFKSSYNFSNTFWISGEYYRNANYETFTFEDLIEELLNSETMTVEVTPNNASTQVVTFDTPGLDEHLPEFRPFCE